MKIKCMATQNVRKFMAVFQIGVLFLAVACSKNEDLEAIANDSPINNDSIVDNSIGNESGIIYIDIEPDFISQNIGDSYHIRVFTLSSFNDSYSDWLEINTNSNGVNGCISVTPWYPTPIPLDSGMEIFNLAGKKNGETYENWGLFDMGYWKDKNDKYLGLRFIKNGQTHYGWARLNVTSATEWVIKDYAYNATPNEPILAGQKN